MTKSSRIPLALIVCVIAAAAFAQETRSAVSESLGQLLLASWPSFRTGTLWLLDNVAKTGFAFGGACAAYIWIGMPESKMVKRRLSVIFPTVKSLDKAAALFFILLGTLLTLVILQPSGYLGAAYAGLSWPALVVSVRDNILRNAKSTTSSNQTR